MVGIKSGYEAKIKALNGSLAEKENTIEELL